MHLPTSVFLGNKSLEHSYEFRAFPSVPLDLRSLHISLYPIAYTTALFVVVVTEPNGDVKFIGAWVKSPFVIRAGIALNATPIDYEFLKEPSGAESEPLLLKSNPVHKKIPVLIHEDKPICESLTIVEYIDEAWSSGSSFFPFDPYDRAISRFWAAYIDEKWVPTLRSVVTAKDREQRKASIEQLTDILKKSN